MTPGTRVEALALKEEAIKKEEKSSHRIVSNFLIEKGRCPLQSEREGWAPKSEGSEGLE